MSELYKVVLSAKAHYPHTVYWKCRNNVYWICLDSIVKIETNYWDCEMDCPMVLCKTVKCSHNQNCEFCRIPLENLKKISELEAALYDN